MDRKEINSLEDLTSSYINACASNDLDYIRFINQHPLYCKSIDQDINQLGFFASCEKDSVSVAKYLLENKLVDLSYNGNEALSKLCANNSIKILNHIFSLYGKKIKNVINYDENYLYEVAALYGNREIIELLFSDDSCFKPNIFKSEKKPLLDACMYGNINVVKLFLENDLFKFYHSQITDEVITNACLSENEDLVEYLLSSGAIEHHANPHASEALPFLFASEKNMVRLLSYLIFTKNIDKTKHIEKHINVNGNLAKKMFETREFKKLLEKEIDKK